jgi:hypothetical protein
MSGICPKMAPSDAKLRRCRHHPRLLAPAAVHGTPAGGSGRAARIQDPDMHGTPGKAAALERDLERATHCANAPMTASDLLIREGLALSRRCSVLWRGRHRPAQGRSRRTRQGRALAARRRVGDPAAGMRPATTRPYQNFSFWKPKTSNTFDILSSSGLMTRRCGHSTVK